MSDDDDDDLFAESDDSGDTDDLIAESKQKAIAKPKKKILKKKGSGNKRKRIPDADNDSDGDDGQGLFDSDSEDNTGSKKSGKKVAASNPAPPQKKPLSKREKMEALRAKKRQVVSSVPGSGNGNKGDDDEDSYNSAEYIRTKEDLDFIDTEGDDADAVAELYAEQNFEDEREAMEEPSNSKKKKKIKGAGSSTYRGRSERAILEAEADEDDPILQAVNKLKKKKKGSEEIQ